MNPNKIALAGLLALAASVAWAQPAPAALPQPAPAPTAATVGAAAPNAAPGVLAGLDVAAERSRIAGEKKQVEDRFKSHETACYRKFAVNDCVEEGRAERRTRLADLRRQEIALNDAERKRKGAAQVQRMEEKEKAVVPPKEMQRRERAKPKAPGQAGQEGQKGEQGQASQGDGAMPPRREPTPPRAPRPHTPKEPRAKDPAATAAQVAQEQSRYERKLKEAAEHKAQTQKRNAEQTKPAAKPLPPA